MQRHDRLAGPGRARDARRAGKVARDQRGLRRMKEDGPFLPRLVERAAQRLDIAENAKAAQGVGMGEGVASAGTGFGASGFSPTASLSNASCASCGRWAIDVEQRVFVGRSHVIDPFRRHAEGHQLELPQVAERASASAAAPERVFRPRCPSDIDLLRLARGLRRAASPLSSDGARSCAARPICRRRRGGRHRRATGSTGCGGR